MDISHQPEQFRFIGTVDGQDALLEYRLMCRNGIDFSYTYVSESLRGQGLAEKLVRACLGWAREQGYEIEGRGIVCKS